MRSYNIEKIKFKYDPPRGDRRYFVDEEDIKVLLSRLPEELYKKLRGVFFKDMARGRRGLGYVTRGRREIVLCALPPRISLASYLRRSQNPSMFGAVRGSQWPTIAVRRYMLYDVFLHELGHMQIIYHKSKSVRRKYAGETKAQDFGEFWCKKLWSNHYDHPNLVHNPPSKDELSMLNKSWGNAHNEYKKGLLYEEKGKSELAAIHYSKAIDKYGNHPLALEALAIFTFYKVESNPRAIGLLEKAIQFDPTLHDANLFLGLAYSKMNKESESRYYFERALRISNRPSGSMAVYARALADWGYWEEAKKLFGKALKKNPHCPFVLRNYKIFLLHDKNPDRENNLIKYAKLFNEEELKTSKDKISIYSRGLMITTWYNK